MELTHQMMNLQFVLLVCGVPPLASGTGLICPYMSI